MAKRGRRRGSRKASCPFWGRLPDHGARLRVSREWQARAGAAVEQGRGEGVEEARVDGEQVSATTQEVERLGGTS